MYFYSVCNKPLITSNDSCDVWRRKQSRHNILRHLSHVYTVLRGKQSWRGFVIFKLRNISYNDFVLTCESHQFWGCVYPPWQEHRPSKSIWNLIYGLLFLVKMVVARDVGSSWVGNDTSPQLWRTINSWLSFAGPACLANGGGILIGWYPHGWSRSQEDKLSREGQW